MMTRKTWDLFQVTVLVRGDRAQLILAPYTGGSKLHILYANIQ